MSPGLLLVCLRLCDVVTDETVVDLSYMPFLLNQERVCVMGGGGGVEGDLIVLKSSNHLPAC